MLSTVNTMYGKLPDRVVISTTVSGEAWNVEVERAAIERRLGYAIGSHDEFMAEVESRILDIARVVSVKAKRFGLRPPQIVLYDDELSV